MQKRTRTIVLVVSALVMAACGRGDGDSFEIGLHRVALDLALSDEDGGARADPREVAQALPVEEVVLAPGYDFGVHVADGPEPTSPARPRPARSLAPPEATACPQAPPHAVPEVHAGHLVKGEPREGRYPRHNVGTIAIEATPLKFTLPYPGQSHWEIRGVKKVVGSSSLGDDANAVPGPAKPAVASEMTQFQILKEVSSTFSTLDTYQYDSAFLQLVERVTTTSAGTSTFRPTPPVRLVALNAGEGTGWSHSGVDRGSGQALTVDGRTVRREPVDVCGTVIETYRVEFKESFVNLRKSPPEYSGNGDKPNVYNILFDRGLLIVREEGHFTQRTSTAQGAPFSATFDFESTLDSLDPSPPQQ